MSVYVDPLVEWGGSKTFPWKISCHLYADSLDELHSFAGSLGLKRAWFQDDGRFPHYDLTGNKRRKAVQIGAVETTLSHLAHHVNPKG